MAKGITYYRRGECKNVSRRSEMRLSAAVAKLEHWQFGYWLPMSSVAVEEDRMVVVLQDWHDDGTEKAVLIQSRGRFAGQYIGTMKRLPVTEELAA